MTGRCRALFVCLLMLVSCASTFLDYAGADIPATMQGYSFRANLAGNTPDDWRDTMYYRYFSNSVPRPAHFGIRTDKHKLIYYDGLTDRPDEQRWEFYDLKVDPHENNNAYGERRYAKVIEQLKVRLSRLQSEVGDQPR